MDSSLTTRFLTENVDKNLLRSVFLLTIIMAETSDSSTCTVRPQSENKFTGQKISAIFMDQNSILHIRLGYIIIIIIQLLPNC